MLGLVGLLAASPFFAEWPAALQTEVVAIARGTSSEIHLRVQDADGRAYGFNDDTPVYIASGTKLAVLVCAYQQQATGRLHFDETIRWRREDARSGSPVTSGWTPGTVVTVGRLIRLAIRHSDNGATDRLMERLGVGAINDALRLEGLPSFGPITPLVEVRRLIYRQLHPTLGNLDPLEVLAVETSGGFEMRARRLADMAGTERLGRWDLARAYQQYYRLGYNSAPLTSMAAYFASLVAKDLVDGPSSEAMLELLEETATGRGRFRSGLPPGTRLAHKTGTQFRRVSDFGIFWTAAGRPVVLVAVIKGARSTSRAEALLAELAAAAYWHLSTADERSGLHPAWVAAHRFAGSARLRGGVEDQPRLIR